MQALMMWLSQFLFLAPISASLLRVTLGLYVLYFAYHLYGVREALTHRKLPVIGHMKAWLVWIGVVVAGVVGTMLFVGYLTQLVAIIAGVIFAKLWWFSPDLDGLGFYNRSTIFLLIVICISIFMTGAGLYAFDLPLY